MTIYTAPGVATVPTGGVTGQVLTKTSSADYATAWQTPSTGGGVSATANGISTSNTAAQNATALNALIGSSGPLANGGTLLCDWVGTAQFDPGSSGFTPNAANLNVRGLGWSTVMKMGGAAINTTSTYLPLFTLNGSAQSIDVADIMLQGPDTLGTGGRVTLIGHTGTGGRVKARNTYFKNMSFGIQLNATNPNTSVDAEGCLFEGYGTGAAQYASQGIGCFEGGGTVQAWVPYKRISVRNCRFTKFGDPSGGSLAHAIYCYETWGLHVEGCEFDNPASGDTGYCIQHYGDPGFSGTTWIAQESLVANCKFGADLGNCRGMFTNSVYPTTIKGCDFQRSSGGTEDIYTAFDALIEGCTFNHHGSQNISTFNAGTVLVTDCKFKGVVGGGCASVYVNATGAIVDVENCQFAGATGANGYYLLMNAAGEIRASNCRFDGVPNYVFRSFAAGKASIIDSKFANTGGVACIANATAALAELHVWGNDFSNSSSSTFELTVTPTILDIANNYGSTGFLTRNSGVASIADGGTISHGLGNTSLPITPSKYMISPTNAAHIVAVTARSSTTLTVAVKVASTGAAVTAAENVAWSAEM